MRTVSIKGTLIPIGGKEDKDHHKDVLKCIITESKKKHPNICVVTCATTDPAFAAKEYRKAFKALGITKLTFIHFETRSEADRAKDLDSINRCDVVVFSGGDQLRLTTLLGGTKLLELIKKRYFEELHFVVAGTSAGAVVMSNTMILSGNSGDAMIKGEMEMTNGLDFINSVIIDTHFTERGRFGRLIQSVTCNPMILGLGLGENTCAIIKKGKTIEVVGSGLVIIVDGKNIVYTNLADVDHDTPVTVEGITMHVIGPGEKFVIEERKLST
jgi:cyanophycinase